MSDTDKQARRENVSGASEDSRLDDTPVGYRNPPRQHRFKKGRSGNPRGRRKGSQNLIGLFKKIVRERVRVRIGVDVRAMTRGEYVLRANYIAALKKNQKAMNNMFAVAEEGRQFVDRDDPKQVGGGPIRGSKPMTMDKFRAVFGVQVPVGHPPKAADTGVPKP